ncbi:YSIRK-type signal peptide-containing protein [Alloscardovia omnicolens]|uniref:YSIRK-type signal peptide-containing protein n=1 Tax=Alloscardovia omnicolens TaxID=419015 RepID=UPI003A629EF7
MRTNQFFKLLERKAKKVFYRKNDRFSLHKFKIGVSSVLLTSSLLLTPPVYANTNPVGGGGRLR